MKYNKLESYVSEPRLKRYLIACSNSKTNALKLYKTNLYISQAFYPVLNLFEIFLRNIIDSQLRIYFKESDWIISEKKGFMSDFSLLSSKFYLRKSIESAEKTITRKSGVKSITAGKVIAEMPFGFWSSLFQRHHYKLLAGIIIHCFPNKSVYANRKLIEKKLNKIRIFRNRIYHNEPVCFNGNTVDFTHVNVLKNDIYDLIEWIDHDLVLYTKSYDNIDEKLRVEI